MISIDQTIDQTVNLIQDGRDIFSNQYVILTLTCGTFFLIKRLQKKTGWMLLNPILIAIILIIIYLKVTGVPFQVYKQDAQLIDFWLKPAVVALGVPLYLQLDAIKRLWLPIVLSQLVGCLVGIVSVGHNPYSNGGYAELGRYSFTHSCRCCHHRYYRSFGWIQGFGDRTCA